MKTKEIGALTSRKSLSTQTKALVLTALTAGLMTNANAAITPPDMAEIITYITAFIAIVASIGMAVLSVYATAKSFKWVKSAF